MVTAPRPHERVGERLFEKATVAVACAETEHIAVIVTFGFEGSGGSQRAKLRPRTARRGVVGMENK